MKQRRPIASASPGQEESTAPETSPALDWAVSHGVVDQVFHRVDAKLRRRRRRRIAAATVCLAVLLGASVLWRIHSLPRQPGSIIAGQAPSVLRAPRIEHLPDGSVVELKENARISVVYSEATRRVTLESGEALFQVAKNPKRPFIVTAGEVAVRAVGTAFAVQLQPQAVDVLVTEGRVAVQPAANRPTVATAPDFVFASVDAGHRTVVQRGEPPAPTSVVAVTPTEIAERLNWRIPRLQLSGTPLRQVVDLVNQHVPVPLVLADPDLGGLELSGIIRADNSEALLQVLHMEFGIEIERRDHSIILHRRR